MMRGAAAPEGALSARRSSACGACLHVARPLHRACVRTHSVPTLASGMKASRWRQAFEVLKEKNVKGVAPKEAANLMAWPRSYALIDVRRADQFAAFHAKGAKSVPLYRLIDTRSGGPAALLRALAFQAQNVDPVEDDPAFLETLRAALAGTGGVVFADAEGGSLEATPLRPVGLVSRALIAAYTALTELQYKGTVLHLEGGLNAWFAAGLPGEGEEDEWAFSGRTPSAAAFAAQRPPKF